MFQSQLIVHTLTDSTAISPVASPPLPPASSSIRVYIYDHPPLLRVNIHFLILALVSTLCTSTTDTTDVYNLSLIYVYIYNYQCQSIFHLCFLNTPDVNNPNIPEDRPEICDILQSPTPTNPKQHADGLGGRAHASPKKTSLPIDVLHNMQLQQLKISASLKLFGQPLFRKLQNKCGILSLSPTNAEGSFNTSTR